MFTFSDIYIFTGSKWTQMLTGNDHQLFWSHQPKKNALLLSGVKKHHL